MNRARAAGLAAAMTLTGLVSACSGSAETASPAATVTTRPPTTTPTVTFSAHPIVTPTSAAASSPPATAPAGGIPAGATLVTRHEGSGTAYVVYAEPRSGSYCLALVAGDQRGEQCVRAVPPANQLDVHTLRTTSGSVALLAGVTGARVARVTVDTDDGSSLSVEPVPLGQTGGKAFAAAVDPGTVSQVTAYDASGAIVARS